MTTVSIDFQSTTRASRASVARVASSGRRGRTWRSRYNASCFRRNRFSAARRACDCRLSLTRATRSNASARAMRIGEADLRDVPTRIARRCRLAACQVGAAPSTGPVPGRM